VGDRLIPISGGLVLPGGGSSFSTGATNISQATYSGTSEYGDVIVLTGQRSDLVTPVVIGTTVAHPDGTWSITTVPLLDGTYVVTANAADAAGHSSSYPVQFPNLVIDTVAPRITNVSLNVKLGKVFVTFQDDRSGLLDAVLDNAANYALTLANGSRNTAIPIRAISVSPGSGSDPRVVTLNVAIPKKPAKAARYAFVIQGQNFTDQAGNVLSESFFVSKSSTPGSGYVAEFQTNGSASSGPQAVHSKAIPKVSKFHAKKVK
jgi:hypothetical protein